MHGSPFEVPAAQVGVGVTSRVGPSEAGVSEAPPSGAGVVQATGPQKSDPFKQ